MSDKKENPDQNIKKNNVQEDIRKGMTVSRIPERLRNQNSNQPQSNSGSGSKDTGKKK